MQANNEQRANELHIYNTNENDQLKIVKNRKDSSRQKDEKQNTSRIEGN